MTQKLILFMFSLSLGAVLGILSAPPPTYALGVCPTDDPTCTTTVPTTPTTTTDTSTKCKNSTDAELQRCLKTNPIVKDLNTIVNFLSGLVGVVVVGVIILGGIQYATAGDKADAVSAAKKRIINGLIALVAFLFIFAFLQWLIPGGVFG